ncbi:F0F1 ATP synthase subunit delta [Dietzia alimentaria]|uniref:F0F1 ATP synthase subunit delta n=1 Tax=Dietzia alimentaria TaxID=665550 RepID=UPI00029B3A31|nr:F0F1 ATP synthase subunit delta [Dietzia alimentaria]
MHAASRDALEHSRSVLQSSLSENPAGGATGAKVGADLFQVVDVLEGDRSLRVAVADSSAPVEAREDLVRSVFGWKIDESSLAIVLAAVALTWSSPRDLREGLVTLGREALLISAREQGQLGAVEDELFRLGRIVASDAGFEQALSDRSTSADSKRALLGQVLYGKVTAVTETLASQTIARPSGMPADDLDGLSRQAAELQGQSVAVVTSASELSAEQQSALEEKLASIYGREMTVHVQIDPEILGGMVIRVGDEIIDGSVAGRLAAVRRALP